MAAEPEDMGSQGVPPSFVPSGKRQRRLLSWYNVSKRR